MLCGFVCVFFCGVRFPMMSEASLERKESFVVPLSFWSRVASMELFEAERRRSFGEDRIGMRRSSRLSA